MLFNSYQFLFGYLPIVFAGFFLIARFNQLGASYWLGLASLVFYGWWSIKAVPLLLISIVANFNFGRGLARLNGEETLRAREARGTLLIAALAANLAVLALFKYANFLIDNLSHVLVLFGSEPLETVDIVLPIGISFYTFTQIAFLVDCWQGRIKEADFGHYLLFVTYFPHLIAGPVLHHAEMMPQFRQRETYQINRDKIALGLAIFILGLAKKLLLADTLSTSADSFFVGVSNGAIPQFFDAWTGVLAYTFQIYFDFSGYSDMAIGISLLFGIRLPLNFDSPYKALSIIDFWRRWHMTLSRFLRDYLYIPLGGSRLGLFRRYVNLFVTMLLGGLWHGANWTFVLWGAAHGVLLSVNHAWRYLLGEVSAVWIRPLSWLVTFFAICLTWVLFRADSLKTAISVYAGLFGINGWGNVVMEVRLLFAIALSFLIVLRYGNTQQLLGYSPAGYAGGDAEPSRSWRVSSALVLGILLFLCLLRIGVPSPFLYFQF